MEAAKRERVIAYIDGYNLFFGLKESGLLEYIWLDVQELIQNLLKPNQELLMVKYFTTVITNNSDKRQRQKEYISALQTLPLVQVFYGKFQNEKNNCNKCGNEYYAECEKMTDVAIATQIMFDYYEDNFDMAMVVSGDTDLLPPVKLINEANNNKRVFVAFPPNRVNDEVRKFAKGDMVIGRRNIAKSQLADEMVSKENGQAFKKPKQWK